MALVSDEFDDVQSYTGGSFGDDCEATVELESVSVVMEWIAS